MNKELLPDISFCETDTAKVEAAVITKYEELAGVTLYPGDPVRLFLEGVAYLLALQNMAIDFTGKQNLLAYAGGDYLVHLGYYLNTLPLAVAAAKTTLAFTLSAVRPDPVVVPQAVRVRAGNRVVFATDADLIIPAGSTTGHVTATCLTAGAVGNSYLPGQIKTLVDPVTYVGSVANTTVSAGGADAEMDDRLRDRISLAAEQYASAGSLAGYRYHAFSVHQGIVDAAVWQPQPGEVRIAPLLDGGELPTDELITALYAHLTADDIQPFTDTVLVVKPSVITGNISLTYYILVSYASKAKDIAAKVALAVDVYIAWQRAVLGRDVLPQKLVEMIQGIGGIQRVEVASPLYQALDRWEVAHLTLDSITYAGLADE